MEADPAISCPVTLCYQAYKLSLRGEEAVVSKKISELRQREGPTVVNIHEGKRLFQIEVRSLTQGRAQDLASSLALEKGAPQVTEFGARVGVEELRDRQLATHIEVRPVRQKSCVFLADW